MRRFGVFIALAGLIVAIWASIAPGLATRLIVERPLARADSIIVLSGSSVYKERTRKAAELLKQGVAPRIFLTNDGGKAGWSESEKTNPSFVDLAQRELIANGVTPDAITVLPGEVNGTESEAKALADELEKRPLGSVLIVTSAYHTRRALDVFEKRLAVNGVVVGIVSAPLGDGAPKPSTWWLSAAGWRDVAGEYVKSAGYSVVYQ